MSMLEVQNLSVRFGSAVIVNDVSFSVQDGDWLMLIGPNGAGKSTIVNAVSRGVPYTGTVLFEGKDVQKTPAHLLARGMGVLAQHHTVGYAFSVEEVVRLGRYAHAPGVFSGRGGRDSAAVEEALELTGLTAQQPASATCAIAFENRAAASLLGVFSSIFSAEAAQKGLSLLKGREGEAIASEAVTIVDDPHRPHSAASQPFDGEGVPTRKKNVVEKGVLQTLLHNLTTAAKQGVATTGNAARGYASAVGVAPSNFYIAPSQESVEAMLARMGEGFLITEVSGLHAGANQISGDFSLLAKGFAVRGGQKAEPVEQITVAGNFFAVLKDVVAVADDLAFGLPGGSLVGSPTIWVKALSVAGK